MCQKERNIGTMVERIQLVNPANFLYNMVKIFANMGNALMPSRLGTSFGAQHESTGFCGWVSSTGKGLVHIPNWKGAGPYPQPAKGAMQKAWIRAAYQKWPQKMPGAQPVCARRTDAPP